MRSLVVCGLVLAWAARLHADPISVGDLSQKNEGGYVTGLPLAAYSTDMGYGAGVRVYYYWDGDRDDPRFKTTPYLYRVFFQYFASTNGLQFHWIDFDAPQIADSPYRVRSQLIYERNTSQYYFGQGDRSLSPLAFPGSNKTYTSFDKYSADQLVIDANGNSWEKYDQYDLLRPIALASIERLFLDGRVRALGGFGVSYASIHDYTGHTVAAVDSNGAPATAIEGQTRLAADCAAKLLVGCSGGRDDFLRLGLSYDTRDFEPDPNTGVFIDGALDLGTVALGSQYNYARAMIAARGYWSPIAEQADLVLAGRLVFEAQSSGTPFFSMDTMPFTEDPRTGLGGGRTIRGFREDRFVGPVTALANVEARWTFGHARLWRQRFAFIVVPFYDIGRPFDSVSEFGFHDWQGSYGGAFRVSWNLATIASIDYARSSEDTGLYVNFNHIF